MLFCNPSGSKESKRTRSWRYYKDNLWPEPRVNRYPSAIRTCKCAGNLQRTRKPILQTVFEPQLTCAGCCCVHPLNLSLKQVERDVQP